jgi:hypothetical protein
MIVNAVRRVQNRVFAARRLKHGLNQISEYISNYIFRYTNVPCTHAARNIQHSTLILLPIKDKGRVMDA